ncbi:MAG: STAS domain-containing protein [Phycisphaerae bacterium]|jgi:anti-anti-sigma factor
MDIASENHAGVTLLRLTGELAGGEDNPLIGAVTDQLGDRGARVVIDLGDVHFMNSAGLGDLVRLVAQANVQESRVVLANLSAYLAGVLEMTKLDRFFETYSTAEDALRTLGEQTRAKS